MCFPARARSTTELKLSTEEQTQRGERGKVESEEESGEDARRRTGRRGMRCERSVVACGHWVVVVVLTCDLTRHVFIPDETM